MNQPSKIGISIKCIVFSFFLILRCDNAQAEQQKVIGFGDSITAGYPYITSDQDGSTVGGYEPPLRTMLRGDGWDVTVLNYGHPGEYSWEGKNRIESVLNAESPDWVLILEGTNDLDWVSTNTVLTNLASMVRKVLAEGQYVVLATLTPDNRGSKPISKMNDKIRAWANENEVPLADQYSATAPDWNSLVTSDELHPNTTGYSVMATTWYETIIANSDNSESENGKVVLPYMFLLLRP